MASDGHIEVAQAYVTIIPSMKGSQKAISDEFGAAAQKAGDEGGNRLGEALRSASSSAMGKVSSTLRESVGTAARGASDALRSTFSGAASAAGKALSGVGSALSGVSPAVSAAAQVVKGGLSVAASAAGKALQGIAPVAKAAFGGIRDACSSALSGLADMASSAMSGLASAVKVGAAGAVAGIVGMGKAAVENYAEFEQLEGGVKKLFGDDAAKTVMENAQNAFRTAGMSANEYVQQATGFSAALVKSTGGDMQEAARLTDVAMRAMSDNVNTFGTDAESVQNAFQGFAKQNYTMLDNLKLGYGGTKQGMVDLIKDSGVLGEAAADLTTKNLDQKVSFGQIVEAIQKVQEQQGIAGTTAKEAGTTIEGSVGMAKAAWDNLLTEFGKDDGQIGERVTELVQSIFGDGSESNLGVFGNVVPVVGRVASAIIGALPDALSRIGGQLKDLLLPTLDEATGGAASGIVERLEALGDRAAAVFEGIRSRLEPLAPAMGDVAAAAADGLVGALEGAMGIVEALVQPLGDIAQTLAPMLADAFGRLSDAGGRVTGAIGGVIERLTPMAPVVADVAAKFGDLLLRGMEAVASVIECRTANC